MGWALAGLALGAVLIALPWLGEMRRRPVRAVQAEAPGALAALSQGRTHYRWQGPDDGPVVVLVHGLTTPSFVWAPIAAILAERGARVLSYDLFGRGYSDHVRGAQDAAFFRRQLDEVLRDQGVEDGFTLVGYSMGGAIAADFTAQASGRVGRLILLAPAGMGHALGAADRLVRWPLWLAKLAMQLVFPRQFRRAAVAERAKPGVPGEIVDGQLAQLQRRGYVGAVLASLRGILAEDLEPAHRAIAASGLPVLAIWGRVDETIPIAAKDVLAKWNPGAAQQVIDDADHALAYSHADAVAGMIAARL